MTEEMKRISISLNEEGEKLYQTKRYSEAFKKFEQAVQYDPDNARAIYNLGCCYEFGQGVSENEALAIKWYRKAAEQGEAAAQYAIGIHLEHGIGVVQSQTEAAQWFRKAAEQGNANAQYSLAGCFEFGAGVVKNKAEAIKWYQKSAEQGNAESKKELERLIGKTIKLPANGAETQWKPTEDQRKAEHANKEGEKLCQEKLYDEAFAKFKQAIEFDPNNAYAQYNIGECYDFGQGIAENKAEAVKWYKKAAERGYAKAQRALGICYECGIGVAADSEKAVAWYQKAAVQGDACAQYYVGACYDFGIGVPIDGKAAITWYQKAAAQGHENAKKTLERMKGSSISTSPKTKETPSRNVKEEKEKKGIMEIIKSFFQARR